MSLSLRSLLQSAAMVALFLACCWIQSVVADALPQPYSALWIAITFLAEFAVFQWLTRAPLHVTALVFLAIIWKFSWTAMDHYVEQDVGLMDALANGLSRDQFVPWWNTSMFKIGVELALLGVCGVFVHRHVSGSRSFAFLR